MYSYFQHCFLYSFHQFSTHYFEILSQNAFSLFCTNAFECLNIVVYGTTLVKLFNYRLIN